MIRTAFSSAVCEMHDMSCAILDPAGQLLAISDGDNPQHIFPTIWSVEEILRKFGGDIHPGDVFIHNDPLTGGTHLNDVAMVAPLFVDGALAFFPVVRVHFEDVGGMSPGSVVPTATESYQEGVRIPVVRAFSCGVRNDALFDVLLSNMRVPDEREGDFESMLGTCRIAQRALAGFVERHGMAAQRAAARQILDRTEARMRAAIARIPPGEYSYEIALDPRGEDFEPLVIRARITVERDWVRVDFTGTSSQNLGPFNLGPAGAPTGVFMILKALLDPRGMVNSGAFRPIEIVNPPGTMLHPTLPVGFGGMGDVRRNVEMAIMGALARVLPEMVTGETKSTANQTIISGTSPRSGRTFIFYEGPTAGTGGLRWHDGNAAMRTFLEGDFGSLRTAEALEAKFPLRVEAFALRPDSGGPGRFRGGLGFCRRVRFLGENGRLTVLSERNVLPPYGVFGGHCGEPTRYTVERGGRQIAPSAIPGKVHGFRLEPGDVVVEETSGGGGYGDPLERPLELVRRDLAHAYVTGGHARERYGVAFRDGAIDETATARRRAELARGRIRLRALASADLDPGRALRPCRLAPATAARAGLETGAVAECLGPSGTPLRHTTIVDPQVPEDAAVLLPDSLEMLALGNTETVEVRALGAYGGIGPERWRRRSEAAE
jgi:N-methylhydantoinase B